MIDLGTLAGLHEHDHQLHAYCARCVRWSVLDLESMVRLGQGERRLPIRVRCETCGSPGELQVRPPMPLWTNARGWIAASGPSCPVSASVPATSAFAHRSHGVHALRQPRLTPMRGGCPSLQTALRAEGGLPLAADDPS